METFPHFFPSHRTAELRALACLAFRTALLHWEAFFFYANICQLIISWSQQSHLEIFAMTSWGKVPRGIKSPFEWLCAQQVEIPLVFILSFRLITEEVQPLYLRELFLYHHQHWVKVGPNGHWVMPSRRADGTKTQRVL